MYNISSPTRNEIRYPSLSCRIPRYLFLYSCYFCQQWKCPCYRCCLSRGYLSYFYTQRCTCKPGRIGCHAHEWFFKTGQFAILHYCTVLRSHECVLCIQNNSLNERYELYKNTIWLYFYIVI